MRRFLVLSFIIVIAGISLFGNIAVFVSSTTEKYYGKAVYKDVLDGTFAALEKGEIAYRIITTEELLKNVPEDIKLLIIPSNAALTDDEVSVIEDYLLRGGRVIAGYEATLRYPDTHLRPNYAIGNYLGIKNPEWSKGPYNYMRLTDEGKRFFGDQAPEYIKMPRGFTFLFDLDGATSLANWTKDEQGNLSSESKNCAIAFTESGIFFGENVFLYAAIYDDVLDIFLTSIRKLAELPPANINITKIKLQKFKDTLQKIADELKSRSNDMKSEEYNEKLLEIKTMQNKLSEKSPEDIDRKELEEYEEQINALTYSLLPSKTVQTRAIWLDHGAIASTKTPEALRKTIKRLYDLGFNVLLPEVIYKGTTISRKLTVYPLNDEFKDWEEDPLDTIIEEAHKYGMEVHAWTWVFAVSYYGKNSEIMDKYPDLVEKDKFGRIYAEKGSSKTGFLSHSNPKSRELIKSAIKEVLKKYPDIDGINLDYIRYENIDIIDHGYDEYSLKAFREETGIDPLKIEKYTNEEVLWHLWRENQVTSFVKEISQELKAMKPNILISADVVNSPTGAQYKFKQNWPLWAKNGYLDIIFTMAYTPSSDDLRIMVDAERAAVGGKTYLYPGMAIFVNKDTQSILKQLQILSSYDGLAMFSLAHMGKFENALLEKGVFREKAVPAHSDINLIIKTFKKQVEELKEIWFEKGLIDKKEASWLEDEFSNLEELSNLGVKLNDLWNEVSKVKRSVSSNISNQDIARKIIDILYGITDILRPRWYIQSRKGKKPFEAKKPVEMVVIEKSVPIPKMDVLHLNTPPKIDGIPNDDCWQMLKWSSPFVSYDKGEEVTNKTWIKAGYNDNYLYILFKAQEDDIHGMQIISGGRDTRVYLGDSVEFFIWPDEKRDEYYHFVISADGSIYDEIGFNSKWNGYIEASTSYGDSEWYVELKLNLEEIGVELIPGNTYRVNFNRSRWRGKNAVYSGWSCTYGSFHTKERFGYITLKY